MLVYFINVSALAFIFSCQQDTIIPWQHSVPSPLSLLLEWCYIAVLGLDGGAFLSCISHCFSHPGFQRGTEQRWQHLKSNVFVEYYQFGFLLLKTSTTNPPLTTAVYYYVFKANWEELCWSAWVAPTLQSWDPKDQVGLCCPTCRDHTNVAEPHKLQWTVGKRKKAKTLWHNCCFHIFFSQVEGCVHQGQGWDLNPGACAPSTGMGRADLSRPTSLNRAECLGRVVRWAVPSLRQSFSEPVGAFPPISRALYYALQHLQMKDTVLKTTCFLGPRCPAAHLFCWSQSITSKTAKPTAKSLCMHHSASPFKSWNLIIPLTLLSFSHAHCIPFNIAMCHFSFFFFSFFKQNSQAEVSRFSYSSISLKK